MQAFIRGNAVASVVQDALEGTGTPNLLVQTDLTQVPTITIAPDPLPPAVLYEGSFAATLNQTLTLGNAANTTVNYTVRTPCIALAMSESLLRYMQCFCHTRHLSSTTVHDTVRQLQTLGGGLCGNH